MKRWKILKVVPDVLVDIFKKTEEGTTFSFYGVPDDARFISVHVDHKTAMIYVVIESQEFPETHPGAELIAIGGYVKRHTAPQVKVGD